MKAPAPTAVRPVILTFVHYYLPGYKAGGPIRTIANMVEALGNEFDFRIVTSDRDATDAEPYPNIDTSAAWTAVGKAKVLYLSPVQKNLRHMGKILRETPHDTLYLNSFFDPDFTQKPLLARRLGIGPRARCIIAPRGEFSAGALKLKAWKKRSFLTAARTIGLHRGLVWQASSQHEEADIRREMGVIAQDIRIAIDLPEAVVPQRQELHRPRAEGEPLRICFLSRISPKKNLDFALEVLGRVRRPVRFDVYGPVRDENHWSQCKVLMRQLPASIHATYRGSVEHIEVSSVLARYDLFFLPTLGENYGHVILEALSAGTPALIANTTPWCNLVDVGVGWELPLDKPEAFVEKIHHMAQMAPAELAQMRARALSFAESRRMDVDAIEATHRLFVQTLQ